MEAIRDSVLVIPSNRLQCVDRFVQAWKDHADWERLIVVWDGPERPTFLGVSAVYNWDDIDREFGDDAWIVSRRNAGCRIFGYVKAAQTGAQLIATIDDDCYPGEPLMANHLRALAETPRWVSSDPGLEARGMTYRSRGVLDTVAINLGLWRGVGDYDSLRSLVDGADQKHFEPWAHSRLVPRGQYVPISTMNLGFLSHALPLMYLPLMGRNQIYDRFDDIWGGIIAKRLCDHLGWHVSIGRPIVNHERASNPFTNLVKEAAGIRRNETFWQEIDAIELTCSDAAGAVAELGEALIAHDEPYMRNLGKALRTWARITNNI